MSFDEDQLRDIADVVEFIRDNGGVVRDVQPKEVSSGGPLGQAMGVTQPVFDLRIELPEADLEEEPEEEPQDIEVE